MCPAFIHAAETCSGCGKVGIEGSRWRCLCCPFMDPPYQLCSTCLVTEVSQRQHHFTAFFSVADWVAHVAQHDQPTFPSHLGMDILERPIHPHTCSKCFANEAIYQSVSDTGSETFEEQGPTLICGQCLAKLLPAEGHNVGDVFVRVPSELQIITPSELPKGFMLQYHNNILCDGKSQHPLVGPRWKCRHCGDFDICTSCLCDPEILASHEPTHELYLVASPIVSPITSISSTKHSATMEPSTATGVPNLPEGHESTPEDDEHLVLSPAQCIDAMINAMPAELLAIENDGSSDDGTHVDDADDDNGPGSKTDKFVDRLLTVLEGILESDLSSLRCKKKGAIFIEVVDHFIENNETLGVCLSLGSECLQKLHQPIFPFNDGVDNRREYVKRAKDAAEELFMNSNVPEWFYDKEFLMDGIDLFVAQLALLIAYRTAKLAPQLSFPSPSVHGHHSAMQLTLDRVADVDVALIPFLEAFRFSSQGIPPPEYHQCTTKVRHSTAPAVYVFISHRWLKEQHPDPDGTDWPHVLHALLYLCNACVNTISILQASMPTVTPHEIRATLIARKDDFGYVDIPARDGHARPIVDGRLAYEIFMTALQLWKKDMPREELRDTLLDNLYLWYDFTSLPQHNMSGEERALKKLTLRNLSQIQRKMNSFIVNTAKDYMCRAWCIAELLVSDGRSFVGQPETDDEAKNFSGFQRSDEMSRKSQAFQFLLNPLIRTPQDVLQAFNLQITNMRDDSEVVCRALWSFIQARVTDLALHMNLYDASLKRPSSLDCYQRHGERLLLGGGRSCEQVLQSLSLIQKLPQTTFDEWLSLRSGEKDPFYPTHSTGRVYFVHDPMYTTLDSCRDFFRDLAAMDRIIRAVGPGLIAAGAQGLLVYLIRKPGDADLCNEHSLLAGYTATKQTSLLKNGSVFVVGQAA